MSENLSMKKALFFPHYVNQPRLLDVFAILNGGFSEYEEIQTGDTAEAKRKNAAKVEAGFKLFKLGAGGGFSKDESSRREKMLSERKVHTTTSMLKLVLSELDEEGYLREIEKSRPGDFVVVPVSLKINSIKSLINETIMLTELGDKLKNLTSSGSARKPNENVAKLKKVSDAVRELFGSEEMVSESEDYAVVASIDDCYLYQSDRQSIVNVEMMCLGQVKLVHEGGAQLLRNTVFAKMRGDEMKKPVLKSLRDMTLSVDYSFENDVIPEIVGKPLYELEVVALYQDTYPIEPDLDSPQ